MTKNCTKCNKYFPLTIEFFYKDSQNKNGYKNICKVCHDGNTYKWSKDNPIKLRVIQKRTRIKNIETRRKGFKEWYELNKEKRNEKVRLNRKKPEYAAVVNYHCSMRKKRIKQATPEWLTHIQKEEIKDFYKAASQSSFYLGTPFDVDHIIPIKGYNVSGLNVPWNLQIITRKENQSKKNKTPGCQ